MTYTLYAIFALGAAAFAISVWLTWSLWRDTSRLEEVSEKEWREFMRQWNGEDQ